MHSRLVRHVEQRKTRLVEGTYIPTPTGWLMLSHLILLLGLAFEI